MRGQQGYDQVMAKPREWLEKHNARRMWETKVKNVGTLTAWNVNGRIVLMLVYNANHGWELFTMLDDNNVDATLADAEKRVGIDG